MYKTRDTVSAIYQVSSYRVGHCDIHYCHLTVLKNQLKQSL